MSLFDPNQMMEEEVDDTRTRLKEEEEADKSYDTHVEAVFESNSSDDSGWYLDHIATFHENTTAQAGGTYYSSPAAYSAPLPSHHPLRVIAKITDDAPNGSVVRVYAYMLSDMDAIGLLAHHANHKTVNVILHPSTLSFNRMTQFFISETALNDTLQTSE